MKKVLFSITLCLTMLITYAQSLPDYSKHPLNTPENVKAASIIALQSANFLLYTPIDKSLLDRINSVSFLMDWMEASKDYTFAFDSSIAVLENDTNYMGLYIAAMAKYQIENKITESNEDSKIGTWKIIADYVNNPANNVDVSGKLRRLVNAYKKDKLEEFLNKL